VFKVCDQPHPKLVKEILAACLDGNIHDSHSKLEKLWAKGYSAGDIVQVPSHCSFCAILCDAREHERYVCLFGTSLWRSLSLPFCLSPFLPSSRFLRDVVAPLFPLPPLLALSAYTGMVCAGQELEVTSSTRVPLVPQAPNEDRRFPLTCMSVPSVPRRPSTFTRPAPTQTRKQTFSRVAGNMDMPEKSKLDFLKIVGEYHMRVLEGADTLVQLSGMLAKMCLLKHNVAPCA
jgi:hypothetical protein